ncbi:protein CASC3 [Erpetoichthys calabaricus]|uniref:Protein CASC3 n=1 Tax=Erpetoichthys calabaricus TaxID=27687 RepID=A0A8C4TL93_ERPCA|nr:protein CASC3 [Erpetoichthys calabaricus]
MADRRRKRASQDSEEEDESGSGNESAGSGSVSARPRLRDLETTVSPTTRVRAEVEADLESECESEDCIEGDAVLSDYESAEENGSNSEGDVEEGDYSDEERHARPQETKPDEAAAEEEETFSKEEKVEGKGTLAGERQSGDGQESTEPLENKTGSKSGKRLDDDEDRKNPAYIPRKGLFFEHDVRGQAQEEDIRPKGRHRKLWKDEGRWEHDKFREDEQAPKSREELIAMYGYDIRNTNRPDDGQPFRPRKPRFGSPPSREKKWFRDTEKPSRASWHSGTSSNPPLSPNPLSGPTPKPYGGSRNSMGGSGRMGQPRNFQSGRTTNSAPGYRENRSNFKNNELGMHNGNHGGNSNNFHPGRLPRQHFDGDSAHRRAEEEPPPRHTAVVATKEEQAGEEYVNKCDRNDVSPKKEERVPESSFAPAPAATQESCPTSAVTSTVPERTVEKKSYSRGRRTRTKASELGKQASVEEQQPLPPPPLLQMSMALPGAPVDQPAQVGPPQNQQVQLPSAPHTALKADTWEGPPMDNGSSSLPCSSGLEHEMAHLSLAGQTWTQSQPPYMTGEMRGIPNQIHMGGGPPQYNRIDEMSVGVGRAKRYSSQRQRPVPEPAPMHIGIMEGHYYDTIPFQGPIYTHGETPGPLPPQGMIVQPEMHLAHPGLHPHQPPAPMPNPGLYAGPPVSITPGQPPPQQLLPPTYYPTTGVMPFGNTNFTYPPGSPLTPIYPSPQAQSQVYGGVTYYNPVQQQAQPKPSPARRTSQPVTIKPPPPEEISNEKGKEKLGT